ncbi:tyrosine-type recombinase/integrase [Streptomyces sp. NPDC050507]|uniref:tyrosine-type recombinase/integrase n=1 Tax=Streptomyces sp. NPDC050507 TaxID=3365619 RepID=UPI0037944DC6
MATIIKRCDCKVTAWARCKHSWVVRFYDPAGDQREASYPHNRKTEAKDFAIKVEDSKRVGSYVDPKQAKRTFKSVWDEWLKFGTREDSSLAQYASVYKNHFEQPFGKRPIGSITASDLTEWKDDQRKRGYKEYGIHGREVILKTCLKYAYEAEIIARNPGKTLNVGGRKEDPYRPVDDSEIPSTEEVFAIEDAIRPMYRSTVWTMAGMGLRPGEALALSTTHLELREGWYRAQNQLTNFGKNEGANRATQIKAELKWSRTGRWVPVPPTTKEAIARHVATWEPWDEMGWLYESETYPGRPPSRTTYTDRWNAAIAKAGLEAKGYTPKSLRHYFASMAIAAGVPLYEVAKWMGHSSTKTTEKVYAHLLEGAEERITGAFERTMADAFRSRLVVAA